MTFCLRLRSGGLTPLGIRCRCRHGGRDGLYPLSPSTWSREGRTRGYGESQPREGAPYRWDELDRVVASARRNFPRWGSIPSAGHTWFRTSWRTVLDVNPDVVGQWVGEVVERYLNQVDVFPIFYELNVFDLFFRSTMGSHIGNRRNVTSSNVFASSIDWVRKRCETQPWIAGGSDLRRAH